MLKGWVVQEWTGPWGNHREHLRMVSCFREVNSDVNCRHLSATASGPSVAPSVQRMPAPPAGWWCWGCYGWAQSPRWPILSRSRAVLGAQCLSSVGGPSHLLSQHNSSSPARVKKAGQEAPSRSAQWHSHFLPASQGAWAGRGYLCLPVWVAGAGFPWHPRLGCHILSEPLPPALSTVSSKTS